MKNKEPIRDIPQLILTKEKDDNTNNAFYTVRIPREFIPTGILTAKWYEYRFIGLKKDIK